MFNFSLFSYSGIQHGPTIPMFGNISVNRNIPSNTNFQEEVSRLKIPWHSLQPNPHPFAYLSWHTKISDFIGRDEEMLKLEEWANSQQAVSIKLLTGPGGIGKSRLAAEFAQNLSHAGWEAGFVDLVENRTFPLAETGSLIIVDYPEEHPDEVSRLLEDISSFGQEHKIRLLLLSRADWEYWLNILNNCRCVNLIDISPLILLYLDSSDTYSVYKDVINKLSILHDIDSNIMAHDVFIQWMNNNNNAILFAIIAAFYSIINPNDNIINLSCYDIVLSIAIHEHLRLTKIAKSNGEMNVDIYSILAVFANLCSGITNDIYNHALMPIVDIDNIYSNNLWKRLSNTTLLNNNTIIAQTPDILSSVFTHYVLTKYNDTAHEILWAALSLNIKDNTSIISRMCHDIEYNLLYKNNMIPLWLSKALNNNINRCNNMLAVITDKNTPVYLIDMAIQLYEQLLNNTDDPELKAVLTARMSTYYKQKGDIDRAIDILEKAIKLFDRIKLYNRMRYYELLSVAHYNMSNLMKSINKHNEAIDNIQIAIDIQKRLTRNDPIKYYPILVDSMVMYNRLVKYNNKKYIIEKAIQTNIAMVKGVDDPDKSRLAKLLNDYAGILMECGDIEKAIVVGKESLDIYKELYKNKPYSYIYSYAISLSNMGYRMMSKMNYSEAIVYYKNSIALLSKMKELYYQGYDNKYMENLIMLAEAYYRDGNIKEMGILLAKCNDIYNKIDNKNIKKYAYMLPTMISRQADYCYYQKDYDKSIEYIKKAKKVCNILLRENKYRYANAMYKILLKSAYYHIIYINKDIENDIGKAVEIRKGTSIISCDMFDNSIVIALMDLMNILIDKKMYEEEYIIMKEAEEICSMESMNNNKYKRRNYAVIENNIAYYLWQQEENYEEAVKKIDKARVIFLEDEMEYDEDTIKVYMKIINNYIMLKSIVKEEEDAKKEIKNARIIIENIRKENKIRGREYKLALYLTMMKSDTYEGETAMKIILKSVGMMISLSINAVIRKVKKKIM